MSTNGATTGWVGKSLPRKEDAPLLTGRGRFMDDLEPVAGMRHAAILRSPHPHARIRGIDTSAAEKLPGVIGVIQATEAVRVSQNIRVISIGPLLGEAIARTAKEESVSSLFD